MELLLCRCLQRSARQHRTTGCQYSLERNQSTRQLGSTGYGVAIYTNHGYEFKPRNPQPPQLPEANPVGVYQRDIEIPADWDGRDIFLHLEGAKSGVYVYINGQEVGYSEDSKNPAEFLINNYLKPGKNSLVLKIFRWSTGSYLECQDFWRMSGIERDVFLFAQPKTHIRDFNVVSTWTRLTRTVSSNWMWT